MLIDLKTQTIRQIIEAIIFSSDRPVKKEELYKFLSRVENKRIDKIIEEIKTFYEENCAIELRTLAGGLRFKTKRKFSPQLKKFFGIKKELKFSKPALETLALIAYKHPITLKEISYFRGTQSSYMVGQLLEAGLIKIAGRKEAPGNPLLYEVTDKFMKVFGLSSINDLPTVEEMQNFLDKNI